MERRKFIKTCCIGAIGTPLMVGSLSSCEGLYYAKYSSNGKKIKIAKSEFIKTMKKGSKPRKYILVRDESLAFPICVYHIKDNEYVSSLLECTHRSCGLDVGGGIYTCPCHGSEFSKRGKVLEGPAETDLKTYKTYSNEEFIIIEIT